MTTITAKTTGFKNENGLEVVPSRVTGITWAENSKKWRVRMGHKHIGLYEEFYAAVYARLDAERANGITEDTDASRYIDSVEGSL